jgi:hypothetical protein
LDDLVVCSPSAEEHVAHVQEVLGRLQTASFTLNPDKVTFGATEIKYLGHLVSSRWIGILPDRVAGIQKYPRPTNLRTLRRSIGIVVFYARFVPDYSRRAAILSGLKKKGIPFVWRDEHQAAFETFKQALCEAPMLQIQDFNNAFVFVTDARDLAVSAVLHQQVGGELVPITLKSFANRR